MRRKLKLSRESLSLRDRPAIPTKPVLIHVNEVYTATAARAALGLGINALRTEVRAGRLQVARRCGRVWFLGQWLLDWIGGGVASDRALLSSACVGVQVVAEDHPDQG